MPPGPDEVHEHHRVAAAGIGEEMEADIAVEEQHGERRGEHREGGDDEQVGGERRPAEHRHAGVVHAGCAQLEYGSDEVDPGHERAYARDLQRPAVVIHPHSRRVAQFRERRIGQPAGAVELPDDQRQVNEQRTRGGEPEAHGVERREGHVAHAELQRHDQIHQADHEWHGDEEDHDRAVRREHLIEVRRRQEARARCRPSPAGCAS